MHFPPSLHFRSQCPFQVYSERFLSNTASAKVGNTSWTPKPIIDSTLSHSDLILSRNDQKPVFRYNALPSFYYLSLNVIKSRSIKMELPPFIVLYNLRKKINLLLNFYFHQISPAEQNRSTNFPNFPSLKYYRTKTIRTYLAV
jgi:hypothetical protein